VIEAVQERLAGMVPQPFKRIERAAQLAAVAENPPPRDALPIAYAIPLAHQANPPQFGTGVTTQRVAARCAVFMVLAAQAQRVGEKAAADVEPYYQAVRRRLVGWMPADTAEETYLEPIAFAAGRALAVQDGLLIWSDEFTVALLLRITGAQA
jgi:hypothetical protein